ncbi:MAG: DUF2914 domain-containing protein [Parcubacteria group bacterium]
MNFAKLESLYEKYERRASSFALLAGFIFDNLTLKRIDLLFENLIMLSYLVISGGGIALLNYFHEYPPQRSFLARVENLLPLFIQFTFGGLFSAFFIFYYRGGAFSSSWPFMVILLFLLVGNEFFRNYYRRLVFQVSIYFLAIFSFFIFFVPVVLKSMGAGIFLLSGAVSLLSMYLFSRALLKFVPRRYEDHKIHLRNSVLIIFVTINALYFLNLIPPIPLSLKEGGVYHSVERSAGNYTVLGEKKKWHEKLLFFMPETVSLKPGAPLYVFSSVFAPTDLNTRIIHDWQYYDYGVKEWASASKVTFAITGGRVEGYRGFSRKENLSEGKWRVDVKTERNQIIGRVRFNIEPRTGEVELEEKVF